MLREIWKKVRDKRGSDLWEPETTSNYTQKWGPPGSAVHEVVQNISYISYTRLPRAGQPVVSV